MVGVGFLKDESMTRGQDTKRYNINSKTSSEVKKWLTITSNINVVYEKFNRDNGGANFVESLRVPPTQVAKHSNGEWGSVRNGRQTTGEETSANPLRQWAEKGRANSTTRRLLGSLSAEIRPYKRC